MWLIDLFVLAWILEAGIFFLIVGGILAWLFGG